MDPDQRRGFWAAIARGLLALLGVLVSPLLALSAVLFFLFAWGIRRGQMWSAVAGGAFLVLPLPLVLWNWRVDMSVPAVIALAIELGFAFLFVRAAVALGRAGGASAGRPVWTAAIVAFAAFWILFRPYSMPSASMERTVLLNESLLVRTGWGVPQRGDLVVFRYPPDPKQEFLKRVVVIACDRLRIVNKQLYVNGAPANEPYAVHAAAFVDSYLDNFPSQPNFRIDAAATEMLARDVRDGEVVVPDGKYFVLGDNRDDSLDSRYWGFVSRDQILGKPLLIYGSNELGAGPTNVTRTIFNTRCNRLLKVL